MKSPQQQVYDKVFKVSEELGHLVTDYLPPGDTPYPFIFIGEQSDIDRVNKTALHGEINQTVHVYNTIQSRSETSNIVQQLRSRYYNLKKTENFAVTVRQVQGTMLVDTTDTDPLWHAVLDLTIQFN